MQVDRPSAHTVPLLLLSLRDDRFNVTLQETSKLSAAQCVFNVAHHEFPIGTLTNPYPKLTRIEPAVSATLFATCSVSPVTVVAKKAPGAAV
jgi:hypothetical protein